MMVRLPNGKVVAGLPKGTTAYEFYDFEYEGYSGERVYDWDDPWGLGPHQYDLPPTHIFSYLYDRDRCSYCGTRGSNFSLDHIVPYAKGGAHLAREFPSEENLAPACDPCNGKKGAKLGWKTLDGRTGFYWDGTPGDSETPPPMPQRAKKRK